MKQLHRTAEIFCCTGATGFLGAQLIRAILTQYPKEGLHLYCLVRADSEEAGLERLIKNMEHYECWKEEYRGFLHPVIGDLSTEKFGLSDEQWQELAQNNPGHLSQWCPLKLILSV